MPVTRRAIPGAVLLAAILALVPANAAASPPPRSPHSSLSAAAEPRPIVGGEVDLEDRFPSAVAIVAHQQRCTGVVIAPRLVLTAAHCLEDLGPGRTVTVYPGIEADYEQRVQGIDWGIHPEYCRDCDEARFDFGYIELFSDLEVPGDLPPPISDRATWTARVKKGTKLQVVGYGQIAPGVAEDPRQRRVASVRVSKLLAGDLEFEVDGDGAGPCEGDSGGPAFIQAADGTLAWVGLHSLGYGCTGVSVQSASYVPLCWLRDEIDVDLLPTGCEDCECVSAPRGCGCTAHADSTGPRWSWLVLLVLLGTGLRTRRSRSRASDG